MNYFFDKLFTTTADLTDFAAIQKSNKERLLALGIKPKEIQEKEYKPKPIQLLPSQNSIDLLSEHINIYVKRIEKKVNKTHTMLEELIDKIRSVIKETINQKSEVFGSYASGLQLVESDIDLVILDYNEYLVDQMKKLIGAFQKLPFIVDCKAICFTAIPVLKLKCNETYFNKRVDITFQEEKHNGLLCVDLIKSYMEIYPPLKPLNLVLKQLLIESNLFDPYQGGLSSYALCLMIISYLQSRQVETNIGQHLIEFLYLYGCEMDYVGKTIYVFKPRQEIICQPIYFNPQASVNQLPTLMILDPFSNKHNVGRPTYNIQAVKFAFCVAFGLALNYQKNDLWDLLKCCSNLQSSLKSNVQNIYHN